LRRRFLTPFLSILSLSIFSLSMMVSTCLTASAQGAPQKAAPKTTAPNTEPQKASVPNRGPRPDSTDPNVPEPEGGTITNGTYTNQYFGLSYPLPRDWKESLEGPPPSESGYYVLRNLEPGETFKGPVKGSALINASDLFFIQRPVSNSMEFVKDMAGSMPRVYKVETAPTETTLNGLSFARFGYTAVDLHWVVLATEIRCHIVEFVFTSRDTQLLESLVKGVGNMKIPPEAGIATGTGGGQAPVCVKDYATGENILHKVDPAQTGPKFTSVPVRLIIDAEGKVKHVHIINAYPDQAKSIKEALLQWTFKPYKKDGKPVEIETGIRFEFPPRSKSAASKPAGSL